MSTVRVQREGGRGHHLITKAKYDANPSAYVRCDDQGQPIDGTRKAIDEGPCQFCGAPFAELHREGCLALTNHTEMTVAELRDLAADRNVDLGDATKKADIVAAIEAAAKA